MNVPSPLAKIPSTRADRWLLLRDVIAQWYPALREGDGVSSDDLTDVETRLRIKLPMSLYEWYSLAGRRDDIWSRQDQLVHPRDFTFNGEHLVFVIENQHVVEWGIRSEDLSMEDPPVYVSSDDKPHAWIKENDTLSEFALQYFVFCLKASMKCRWWANSYVVPNVLNELAKIYPKLPFPEWHWAPTRFFGFRDLIAEVHAETSMDYSWLYAVARTTAAAEEYKYLLRRMNVSWDVSSEDWPPGWVSVEHDLQGWE